MKAGEIVKIYEDPNCCEIYEEDAKLIEQIIVPPRDDQEYWCVEFLSEPGNEYYRWVNIANH